MAKAAATRRNLSLVLCLFLLLSCLGSSLWASELPGFKGRGREGHMGLPSQEDQSFLMGRRSWASLSSLSLRFKSGRPCPHRIPPLSLQWIDKVIGKVTSAVKKGDE